MSAREKLLGDNGDANPYRSHLTLGGLICAVAGSSAIAFVLGCACRELLMAEHVRFVDDYHHDEEPPSILKESLMMPVDTSRMPERHKTQLPPVIVSPDKKLPETIYSSRHFHPDMSSASDNFAQPSPEYIEVKADGSWSNGSLEGNLPISEGESFAHASEGEDEVDEEEYEPAGQHLLIDMEEVDADFLDSEERLASAMLTLIQSSGLTLLSYHCHGLQPVGVSCVGVLLESHVSFHTWPMQGVITLDLFTCGPMSLLPLLPIIDRLFGVPRKSSIVGDEAQKPRTLWSYKPRGFPEREILNPATSELSSYVLGRMDYQYKEQIVMTETEFQEIAIFDVIDPRYSSLDSYKKSQLIPSTPEGHTYETRNAHLFKPNRNVYLDGIMQSRLFGEASYHEALVHPAMVAHHNPKRVAVIGGGEGATLREILKHRTVEKVTMIEIDEKMVSVSREHLPEWSDCRNLIGSAPSCFDDHRTETLFQDAVGWFIDRFSDPDKIRVEDKYDVIYMDALDPSSVVEFSDVLYGSKEFMRSLSNALNNDGILTAQVGEDYFMDDAGHQYTKRNNEIVMMGLLQANGFKSIKSYSEGHCGFMDSWRYLIAFKEGKSLSRFYSSQAQVDLALRHRAMATVDPSTMPFQYFDGATMMTYQFPSRPSEQGMCRSNQPDNHLCYNGHGFDPEIPNAPLSSQTVVREPRFVGGLANGTYLGIDEAVHGIKVQPASVELLEKLATLRANEAVIWNNLINLMERHGSTSDLFGGKSFMMNSLELARTIWEDSDNKISHNATALLQLRELLVRHHNNEQATISSTNPVYNFLYNPFLDRNQMYHYYLDEN